MTELRRRMIRDMTVRGMAPRTQQANLGAVQRLAAHCRRAPDRLTVDEVRRYLESLVAVRKLSYSPRAVAANAFRFFYHVTLKRDRVDFEVPMPEQPQRLPAILSREEAVRLIESPLPGNSLVKRNPGPPSHAPFAATRTARELR